MTTPAASPAPAAAPAAPAAPQNGTAPAAAKPTPAPEPKYLLTVDGAEREVTRSEAQKLLGKAAFADKLIQQAKDALKKTAEARAKASQEEPELDDEAKLEEWLTKRGAKQEVLDRLARRRLEQRVKTEELTPEQREAAAIKAENERLKKEGAERAEADKKAKQAAAESHLQRQMESQLKDAAEKAGMVGDIDSFDCLRAVVREWVELEMPWDPARIVETAAERLNGATAKLQKEGLGRMDGKALHEFLGKDALKKLNEYQVQLVRGGGRPAPARAAPTHSESVAESVSPQTLEQKYRSGFR